MLEKNYGYWHKWWVNYGQINNLTSGHAKGNAMLKQAAGTKIQTGMK